MRILLRCIAILSGLLCTDLGHADIIQLTSPASLSPSDTTLLFPNNAVGVGSGSPAFYSAGGNMLVFVGIKFEVYQVGTDYTDTGFANGTNILETSAYSSPESQMEIAFINPVTQVGFNIEQYFFGAETFQVDVHDVNNTTDGRFYVTGNDPNSLAFIGVQATGGQTISWITIQDEVDSDIAVGPITFGSPSVAPAIAPEPGTLLLLGTGMVSLLTFRRRSARTSRDSEIARIVWAYIALSKQNGDR